MRQFCLNSTPASWITCLSAQSAFNRSSAFGEWACSHKIGTTPSSIRGYSRERQQDDSVRKWSNPYLSQRTEVHNQITSHVCGCDLHFDVGIEEKLHDRYRDVDVCQSRAEDMWRAGEHSDHIARRNEHSWRVLLRPRYRRLFHRLGRFVVGFGPIFGLSWVPWDRT